MYPIVLNCTIPFCLTVHFQANSQDTSKSTISMLSSTPLSILSSIPVKYTHVYSQGCFQICSQRHFMVHSRPAWLSTFKWALMTLQSVPLRCFHVHLGVCSHVHLWVCFQVHHWVRNTPPSTLSSKIPSMYASMYPIAPDSTLSLY